MKFSKLLQYHFLFQNFIFHSTILCLKWYVESFYIDIILKENKIVKHLYNTLTVPCEKSEMVSFASSIMENIVASSSRFRFQVKLICCIAF